MNENNKIFTKTETIKFSDNDLITITLTIEFNIGYIQESALHRITLDFNGGNKHPELDRQFYSSEDGDVVDLFIWLFIGLGSYAGYTNEMIENYAMALCIRPDSDYANILKFML